MIIAVLVLLGLDSRKRRCLPNEQPRLSVARRSPVDLIQKKKDNEGKKQNSISFDLQIRRDLKNK